MLFFLRPFVVVLSAFGFFKDFFVVVVTSLGILLLLLFLSLFYCCYFQTNSNWSHSLQLSTTPSDLIYDYVATLTPHYLTLTFSTLLYPLLDRRVDDWIMPSAPTIEHLLFCLSRSLPLHHFAASLASIYLCACVPDIWILNWILKIHINVVDRCNKTGRFPFIKTTSNRTGK